MWRKGWDAGKQHEMLDTSQILCKCASRKLHEVCWAWTTPQGGSLLLCTFIQNKTLLTLPFSQGRIILSWFKVDYNPLTFIRPLLVHGPGGPLWSPAPNPAALATICYIQVPFPIFPNPIPPWAQRRLHSSHCRAVRRKGQTAMSARRSADSHIHICMSHMQRHRQSLVLCVWGHTCI